MKIDRSGFGFQAFFHSSAWLFLGITAWLVFLTSRSFFESGSIEFLSLADIVQLVWMSPYPDESAQIEGPVQSRSGLIDLFDLVPVVVIALAATLWMFSLADAVSKRRQFHSGRGERAGPTQS